jgi:UDP-glucose 4-epimerase
MSILITGGVGFIGSHLAEHFHRDHSVRVLDNFRSGHRRNLTGLNVEIIEASITDRAAVRAAMRGAEYVFHLAAMTSVPESIRRPHECVEANVVGLLNVLEEAVAAGVRRLCFSSSAAIYGDNPVTPKSEELPPAPCSPYAITKLDGEYYCRLFAATGRIETVALRYFNVFGPRQDPNSAYAAAVPIFIRQALAGQPLTIFGDGQQTRDFIYVKDVVAANVFVATQPGLSGVFNVGYGKQMTILQLARRIIAATGSNSVIQHAPERPGDVKHSRASIEKLHAAGFCPPGSFDVGLAETISYFRQHPTHATELR